MNPICILEDFSAQVKSGSMLFRITSHALDDIEYASGEDYTLLLTIEKVNELILTHRYNPLLYLVDLPLLIAYLTGCLNRSEHTSHSRVYLVRVRELGSRDEKRWFTISPYQNFHR